MGLQQNTTPPAQSHKDGRSHITHSQALDENLLHFAPFRSDHDNVVHGVARLEVGDVNARLDWFIHLCLRGLPKAGVAGEPRLCSPERWQPHLFGVVGRCPNDRHELYRQGIWSSPSTGKK